jgi:hypothetical protein
MRVCIVHFWRIAKSEECKQSIHQKYSSKMKNEEVGRGQIWLTETVNKHVIVCLRKEQWLLLLFAVRLFFYFSSWK